MIGRAVDGRTAWLLALALLGGLFRIAPRGASVRMACVALALALLLPAGPVQGQETFARSKATIETASGGRYVFDVELAVTPAQQAQGLMFRHDLPEDAGMLFLYDKPLRTAFWMKNTPLPLDMLFIEEGGRIINIHANAVPYSLDAIRSAGPVKGVLEINGGMAARLGVRPGDRVIHPGLIPGG